MEVYKPQVYRPIVLIGEMGAGKDFIAEILSRRFGYYRLAFADALKEDIADLMDTTVEDVNKNKAIYRRILQEYGQLRRVFDEDYWVKRVISTIEEYQQSNIRNKRSFVVTDCRHENEDLALAAIGSVFIRIDVPEVVRDARITKRDGAPPTPEMKAHFSEISVINLKQSCDFMINGESTEEQIVDFFSALFRGFV